MISVKLFLRFINLLLVVIKLMYVLTFNYKPILLKLISLRIKLLIYILEQLLIWLKLNNLIH